MIQNNSYRKEDTNTSKKGVYGGKSLEIWYQRLDRRRTRMIAKMKFTSPLRAEKPERTLTVGLNHFVNLSSLHKDSDL